MTLTHLTLLHYSAPPVIGGVEAVIDAHCREMLAAGYPVSVIAGRGEASALPSGARFEQIDLVDSQYPEIVALSGQLEQGVVPERFETVTGEIFQALRLRIQPGSAVLVHNVFSKHFNLPLTAALHRLIDDTPNTRWIAWSHDFSWTSSSSRRLVHPGYPWDLLRAYRPEITYVTVSQARQAELAGLFGCPPERIRVVYNGVSMDSLLGISPEMASLADRLNLLEADLILLMPVRVTRAKNIEYAMQVLRSLVDSGLRPILLVVGPPDPHDEQSMAYFRGLQDKRNALGLRDRMTFIYEISAPNGLPLVLDNQQVGQLYRLADAVFMPSLREGFGIPVLEAGLAGARVFSTPIPAAVEIGGEDISLINLGEDARETARAILDWAASDETHRLRRKVRQQFTWRSIFRKSIQPLL